MITTISNLMHIHTKFIKLSEETIFVQQPYEEIDQDISIIRIPITPESLASFLFAYYWDQVNSTDNN